MPNIETEIEYKFDASNVQLDELAIWAMEHKAVRYLKVTAPDHYYHREGSDHVVRHRMSGGAGELTVKTRKSKDSTVERQEIDLQFADSITGEQVHDFLIATGWQREITIHKCAHIWWFDAMTELGCPISLALYDAWIYSETTCENDAQRRLLEIEVEKGVDIPDVYAMKTLDFYKDLLRIKFPLGEPLNLSLYEMYSGKQYRVVK